MDNLNVFDPNLSNANNNEHGPMTGIDDDHNHNHTESASAPPVKRRPGRPKGSTKKNFLSDVGVAANPGPLQSGSSPVPAKVKRPVGRPRKDGFPAGSIVPKSKRPRTTAFGGATISVAAPGPNIEFNTPYNFTVSAPIHTQGGTTSSAPSQQIAAPVFQLDPSLQSQSDSEWATLSQTNHNAFLASLLSALASPNPISSSGPTVEEAFRSNLVSLAPNPQQMQSIPPLYCILKTFWLPTSPAYFSLTASALTTRPSSEHRFLYWDPQPLVFNGIQCPSCSAPLINMGRIASGPVKIYDIERPFFIIGCEYICRSASCVAGTSSPEGRKFASTDAPILRSLPTMLKEEFPAKLLSGEADSGSSPNVWNWRAIGVSTGLWELVLAGVKAGLARDVILKLIFAVQKRPDGALNLNSASKSAPLHPVLQIQINQDEKMEEEEGEGDEEGEGGQEEEEEEEERQDVGGEINAQGQQQQQQQGTPPMVFNDAFRDAWKDNASTAPATTVSTAAPPPAPAVESATTFTGPNKPSNPTSPILAPPPTVQPVPVSQPTLTAYNTYATYPFPPYAYMQAMGGQIAPQTNSALGGAIGVAQAMQSSISAHSNGPADANKPAGLAAKRSPRHCCKCGSQECKGKGGRSFCTNGCQDCGKMECKGRNSRRPDKRCEEGWL